MRLTGGLVPLQLCQTVVVKMELSLKVKLFINQSILSPTFNVL